MIKNIILEICNWITIITFIGLIISKLLIIYSSRSNICDSLKIIHKTTSRKEKLRKKQNFISVSENEYSEIFKIVSSGGIRKITVYNIVWDTESSNIRYLEKINEIKFDNIINCVFVETELYEIIPYIAFEIERTDFAKGFFVISESLKDGSFSISTIPNAIQNIGKKNLEYKMTFKTWVYYLLQK